VTQQHQSTQQQLYQLQYPSAAYGKAKNQQQFLNLDSPIISYGAPLIMTSPVYMPIASVPYNIDDEDLQNDEPNFLPYD
jgi:hypothetical protein